MCVHVYVDVSPNEKRYTRRKVNFILYSNPLTGKKTYVSQMYILYYILANI